ncbi:MAG TPA: nucleotidyltransferase family protein [Casimicrobiaceae bacterium]
MSTSNPDLLPDALGDPASLASAAFPHWEELVRHARSNNLLGVLAERLSARALLDRVPPAPRAHFIAAQVRAQAQAKATMRELRAIVRALAGVETPVILLKGAAYLCAGLPAASGRVFSDVDILVAKARLPEVEAALMLSGFVTTHPHPYDQRYYRTWMHELPPMQHLERQTILDVHHALVPETSRMHPDSAILVADAVAIDPRIRAELALGQPEVPIRYAVLSPADMTIHCATHLFCDEEFGHAPRDLVDFDGLARYFAVTEPDFWTKLLRRARTLQLARPLYYALRWSSRVHGTPVPAEVLREARADAPPFPIRQVMDTLLGPALRPTRARASTRWARRALYVRGHWLKMPPHLLAWHLTVKAFRREETRQPEQAQGNRA